MAPVLQSITMTTLHYVHPLIKPTYLHCLQT